MIKVLIADDELLVRVGLKTTVKWEENGFLLVGEAQNGKEAIELFDKYDPDILITDIKMPIIDGLELISILQEKKKELKSIILTHYDDFSYAHKAIKLGASEYMLKHNISSEELLKVLIKLSLEIDSAHSEEKNKKDYKNIGEDNYLDYLLEMAYLSSISKKRFGDLICSYHFTAKHQHFFIAYGKIRYDSESDVSMKDNLLIKNLSRSLFPKENVHYTDMITEECLILLFNIDFIMSDVKIEQADYVKALRRNLKQFFGIDMIFGISGYSNKISDIPKLLDEGRVASERYFFNDSQEVFFYDSLEKLKLVSCVVENDLIMECIKTLDYPKLHDYIDDIFLRVYESYDVNCVRKAYIDLISFARILNYEKNKNSNLSMSDSKFDYDIFNKLETFETIKKYVHDVYDSLMEENKRKVYSHVITNSIKYIKKNYERNISLEEVANYVEISKSYLSLLFKQETGINFSHFLTNYRVEQSKKYILETSFKIYEIAEKVGFDNPYYFSRVFKDKVGMSCKEFKNENYPK